MLSGEMNLKAFANQFSSAGAEKTMSELTIRIDAVAQGNAEQASALLQKLRERFEFFLLLLRLRLF